MEKQKVSPEELQLQEISKGITPIEKKVNELVIKDEDSMLVATDLVSQLRKKKNEIEDGRLVLTKPLNDHVKFINGIFNPKYDFVDNLEKIVDGKIKEYRRELEKARIAEEDRLRKLQEKENEKNLKKGKPVEFNVAPVVVPSAPAKIESKKGAVSFTKFWNYEIEDFKKLPAKYVAQILNLAHEKGLYDTVVRKAVEAGEREIAGVRIFEDEKMSHHV